jgi:hypothetical protein
MKKWYNIHRKPSKTQGTKELFSVKGSITKNKKTGKLEGGVSVAKKKPIWPCQE